MFFILPPVPFNQSLQRAADRRDDRRDDELEFIKQIVDVPKARLPPAVAELDLRRRALRGDKQIEASEKHVGQTSDAGNGKDPGPDNSFRHYFVQRTRLLRRSDSHD